ncbi:cytochrome P450 [Schizophyllum amplum]|uniref:Cytochrome P450 n=1 Tax=Schizophyllum amplum TaxID=97359 RepID=A0A550C567_9AGAR|nr:cytochrome P450 [Auriculariopsis ampla]
MTASNISGRLHDAFLELDAPVQAALLAGGATALGYTLYKSLAGPDLSSIPAIGSSGLFSSYTSARMFQQHAREMVQEGVNRYPGAAFRVPLMDQWTVVVSGHRLVDELRTAREDELSFREAVEETIQLKYTMGFSMEHHNSQLKVVQQDVTRNIGLCFPDVYDEVQASFDDVITFEPGQEWCTVGGFQSTMTMVARVSNRYFVGLPLCRNDEFLRSNMRFAMDVISVSSKLKKYPGFLRPLLGNFLSPYKNMAKDLSGHVGTVVAQRIHDDDTLGNDRPDRPTDLISWILNHVDPRHRTVDDVVMRIMGVNFAAIHTSTSTFTNVLFHLAAEPEYIEPLREEVEEVVGRHGWTKTAMREMIKLDSFLRESGRFNGLGCLSLNRKVVKKGGFTFTDGTHVPVGAFISVASDAIHHNEGAYKNAHVFDGFRYSRLRETDPTKYQMVNTDCDYVLFGHGFHACPGRFFAANELKAMLAHLVLHYAVQLEGGSRVKPENEWNITSASPNRSAKVMFRKRQD